MPKRTETMDTISMLFPKDLSARLSEAAERQTRSRSSVVREALMQFLDKQEQK